MAGNTHIVVCGMGNALYGDDGIGPAFIRQAKGVGRMGGGDVVLLDCGKSPGQKLKEIVSFLPSVVVVVSAADMGRSAGAVQLFSTEDAKKALLSSHKVDFEMFLRYLEGTLPEEAKIFVICVQPGPCAHGGMLSPAGKNALMLVARLLDEILSEHGHGARL
jgi:coenzyme F420 hydrogenase subunit delta